jgi:hypothetical protein
MHYEYELWTLVALQLHANSPCLTTQVVNNTNAQKTAHDWTIKIFTLPQSIMIDSAGNSNIQHAYHSDNQLQ